MKKCIKCKRLKPETDFVKQKECRNGRSGTCRKCQNLYVTAWKQRNSVRIAAERRKRYAETEGVEVRRREEARRARQPLRVRCQIIRCGMLDRARILGIPFESEFLTVPYLMDRIGNNPHCECCKVKLAIEFRAIGNGGPLNNSPSVDRFIPSEGYTRANLAILCWRCNNLKRDATATELFRIARWMKKRITI